MVKEERKGEEEENAANVDEEGGGGIENRGKYDGSYNNMWEERN